MKKSIFTIAIVIMITSWLVPQKIKAQGVSVGFQVFYDDLSPYGTWISSPEYGYVWLPSVEAGFTPYSSNGYWANTEYGWTWVSNYSWGWAPFHYGRWYTDPMYGPMWVPGNEWGPGWVSWRQSEGYYGWAPIGPGISIEMAYSANYSVPNDHWCFVRSRDFGRSDIHNYYVDRSTNVTIINNTTVINNTYIDKQRGAKFNSGPKRDEVEKRAGKQFAPVAIKENSKPGQSMGKGEMNVYRPQVNKNTASQKKEAPVKVADRKDLKQQPQKSPTPAKQEPNQKAQPQQGKQQPAEPNKQEPTQTKQRNEPVHKGTEQKQTPVQPHNQQAQPPTQRNEPKRQQQEPPRNQPAQPPHQPQQNQPNKEQPPRQQPQKAQPPREQPQQPQQRTEPPRQQPVHAPNQPNKAQPRQESPRQEAPRQEQHQQETPPQPKGTPPPHLEGEGQRPH